MKDNEIIYMSVNKNWCVRYSMWDLGDKYKLLKKVNGRWLYVCSYYSPLAAMTAMKKFAGEWL